MTGSRSKAVVAQLRLRQQERLLDSLLRSGALADRFGDETAEAMRVEILREYRRLVPGLPELDPANPMGKNITLEAMSLAVYRVVLRHGGGAEDYAELLHRMYRAYLQRIPRTLRPLLRRFMFSTVSRRRLEQAARRSQARRYPADWVFSWVEGDGKTFDFGIDITECALVKYARAQGAPDAFTRSMCEGDYIQAAVLGYGLNRTKALAWGCDKCDFRFRRGGSTSAPWPPVNAEATCGEPPAETAGPAPAP